VQYVSTHAMLPVPEYRARVPRASGAPPAQPGGLSSLGTPLVPVGLPLVSCNVTPSQMSTRAIPPASGSDVSTVMYSPLVSSAHVGEHSVSHGLVHVGVLGECMQVVAGEVSEVPPDKPVPSRAVTSDQPVSVRSVCEVVAEQTQSGSPALPESRESVHRTGGPHSLPASGPPGVGEQTMPGQPPERTSGEVSAPAPAGATDLPVRAPSDVGATALPGQAPHHTSGAPRGTRPRQSQPRAGGAHGAPSPRERLRKRVLIMFSGPLGRPDGLAAELCKLGFEVVEIDKLAGGDQHDIQCDATFARLRAEISVRRLRSRLSGYPL
jgi:hypothetical protein